MKAKKMMALLLTAAMGMSALTGCGGGNGKESEEGKGADKKGKDVVTALLPPVSATYQDKITEYVKAFTKNIRMLKLKLQQQAGKILHRSWMCR